MEKTKEQAASDIIDEFIEVYDVFRLYNRSEKEEYHIKNYLKHLASKHLAETK